MSDEKWYPEGIVTHEQKKLLYSLALDLERQIGDVCVFLGFSQEQMKSELSPDFNPDTGKVGESSAWDRLLLATERMDNTKKKLFLLLKEIGAYPS